ncbi:MAG: protein phosphatase CheZ [Kiloniellaceae bacterium]
MQNAQVVKEFSVERHLRRRRRSGSTEVTNAELLDSIQALHDEIAALRRNASLAQVAPAEADKPAGDEPPRHDDSQEAVAARIEIAAMVRMIGQAKSEIAAIKHPMSNDDRMLNATSELDAIVLATETSTEDVLAASETIEIIARRIAGLHHDDEDVVAMTEQIGAEIIKIFEACNFQDITGQRITKVIKTIRFIEEKILTLIDIWGVDAFSDLPVAEITPDKGDADLMNGPQLSGQGISQDDINALFD